MDVDYVCIKNEIVEMQEEPSEVLQTEHVPLPTSYDFAKKVLKLDLQEVDRESFPIICSVMSIAKEDMPGSHEVVDTKPSFEELSNVTAAPRPSPRPSPQPSPQLVLKRKTKKERANVHGITGKYHTGTRVKTEFVDLEEPSTSCAQSHHKMRKVKTEPKTQENHVASSSCAHSSPSSAVGGEMGAVQQLLTTLQKPIDVDQVFGDYVSCELRSVRNPDIKRRLKRIITQAILDAMAEDV